MRSGRLALIALASLWLGAPAQAAITRGPSPGDALEPAEILSPADSARRLEERRTEQQHRREAELAEEARIRPRDRRGTCDAPATTRAPQLCIRLVGPRTMLNGSERRLRVEWRNLPEVAIFVSVERAAPAGERRRYRGLVGPLPLGLGLMSGDGARDVVWNGRELGCGQPGACRDIEIGTYRFSGDAVVIEPGGRRRGQPSPVPVVWTLSDDFEITGSFDMRSVLFERWTQLGTYLERRTDIGIPFYDTAITRAPMPARRNGAFHCAETALPPPLRGRLRTCVPARFVDRIGVSARAEDVLFGGRISYLPGVVTSPQAVDAARRVAMRGYERAADYIGWPGLDEARRGGSGDERNNPRTWLDTDIGRVAWRQEAGGYWLVVVNQMVRNFRGGGPAGPFDTLLVRVERNGRACLVARGAMESYRPGINSSRGPGGMTPAQARPNYDPAGWDRHCTRRSRPAVARPQ